MSYCLNPNCPEPQNPDSETICLACGSKLLLKDRYRSIGFLDSGGMSRNFLAIDTDMPEEKRCVIKQFFPAPQVLDDPEAFTKSIELFQREAEQLDRLGNESTEIPQLFAYLEQERRFYLIQEYIDGQNLLKELDQTGAYSENQILQLLTDLLPILKFVHDRGVIHRDIKPENIMRRKNGQLVLIDFGMSKHLNSTVMSRGTTGGTMGYAPPEQIRAGIAYPASDIYALGATCVHLLTDITPDRLYDFKTNKWLWRQYLASEEIVISDRLGGVIDRMLMTEVQDRHQSIGCIVSALDAPANNWKLQAIIVGCMAAVLTFGLGVYFNRQQIDCQLGNYNKLCPRPIPPVPQKPQRPTKIGDVLYYPYLTATDSRGKSAEINMAILSDRYEWKLGSSNMIKLKKTDQTFPISTLKQVLEKQGIFKIMNNPNRIIAIGTASCEGSDSTEENRALDRAQTIQKELIQQLFQVNEYKTLNLGQFKNGSCQLNTKGTDFQRSLVIVGMRKESAGLELKGALYKRLGKTIENLDLNDYSLGSLEKFDLK